MADSVKKASRVVPLDADKLGFITGAVGAFTVALVQMFLREADLLTTIFRAGMVFVGVYAASFWLVRRFLLASLLQMLDDKRRHREERRAKIKERREEARAQGSSILDMLEPAAPEQPGTETEADTEASALSEAGLPSL
jgi:hypothetical protein